MFTFNGYKHQGHSICSRKPPSKFVIGAFFRLVMLYKETKKKIQKSINNSKNTYLFENSTIHRKQIHKHFVKLQDIRFAVENHPHSLFAVFGHFFFVYLNYSENCWEMFAFNGYKHQGHSICSRKPPSKFVIGAFFRLHQGHSVCSRKPPSKFVIGAFFRQVMLYKETKKKFQKSINNSKNTHLFENSTIHR
ncbi:hypothetical protein AGLY_017794 [Aphis glycines]|uniref:Uncharacterized protein n=1 Tax=Aphis glycines TaxID=307491 RepID=A0A6G0SUI2_APHGL|nr:hypothetical protein AGLY_017794 [Aphis glycines]